MGGASSLFHVNDWEKADGKLTSSDQTIDRSPPTTAYGIYYLSKRKLNQREFDVTDADDNLLFTTRAVIGTICCFDVLGKGIDEYLFRVTVDIARRYWIVYRFHTSSFDGQIHDETESAKATADLKEKNIPGPIKLFKVCCITVSWSRYMAVAASYGPPTADMLTMATTTDESESEQIDLTKNSAIDDSEIPTHDSQVFTSWRERTHSSNSNFESSCTALPQSMSCLTCSDGRTTPCDENNHISSLVTEGTLVGDEDGPETLETKSRSLSDDSKRIAIGQNSPRNKNSCNATGPSSMSPEHKISPNRVNVQSAARDDASIDSLAAGSAHSAQRAALIAMDSAANLHKWFVQQSSQIREKSKTVFQNNLNSRHPLEGVIHLERPLLLCQEIYTHLIGNHQTSLVSKERVIELLKQDEAQHVAGQSHNDKTDSSSSGNPILTIDGKLIVAEETFSPGNGTDETKENTSGEARASIVGKSMTSSETSDSEKEQPLVAYWNWEHTLRSQKMKLHLAKRADLALHAILAIIVNQVRYERNAIAMAI